MLFFKFKNKGPSELRLQMHFSHSHPILYIFVLECKGEYLIQVDGQLWTNSVGLLKKLTLIDSSLKPFDNNVLISKSEIQFPK
jgi:hypothetical protein